jgi:hypothetical protein
MSESTLMIGAVSGFAATAPMTIFMELMHKRLPPDEQYPLPPGEIESDVTEKAGVSEQLDRHEHTALTMASHFAYGTAAGAVYAPLAGGLHPNPLVGGIAFGLAVWGASYMGLLPALGILKPASEHPPRRTALMIAAHVIWGSALGVLVDRLGGDNRR